MQIKRPGCIVRTRAPVGRCWCCHLTVIAADKVAARTPDASGSKVPIAALHRHRIAAPGAPWIPDRYATSKASAVKARANAACKETPRASRWREASWHSDCYA